MINHRNDTIYSGIEEINFNTLGKLSLDETGLIPVLKFTSRSMNNDKNKK